MTFTFPCDAAEGNDMRLRASGAFLSGFLFLAAGFGQAKATDAGPSFSCAHPFVLEAIIYKNRGCRYFGFL